MADTRVATAQIVSPALVRRLVLSLIVAAVVYGAFLLYSDAPALFASVRALSASTILIATALACGNYVVRLLRWEYYLRKVGVSVPIVPSTLVFLSGFAMSITPGKMGEALKSLMLRDAFDVPLVRTAPIAVAERLTDLVGMLLLSGIAALALPGGAWISAICGAGSLAIGVLLFWHGPREWLIDRVTRMPRLRSLRPKLLEAHQSFGELLTPRSFVIGNALSMIAWAFHGFALACAANAFPNVSLSLPKAILAYSAPVLAGALALIPGGLGLTEASMVGVLEKLGGPGATLRVASAITLVVRLVTFWLAVALGFLALSLWRRVPRHRPEAAAERA